MTWWFYFIVYRSFYSVFSSHHSCFLESVNEMWHVNNELHTKLRCNCVFLQTEIRTFVASHLHSNWMAECFLHREKHVYRYFAFVYEFHLYIDWIPMCTRDIVPAHDPLWSLLFFSLKFFFFAEKFEHRTYCVASLFSFLQMPKNIQTNFIWNLKSNCGKALKFSEHSVNTAWNFKNKPVESKVSDER